MLDIVKLELSRVGRTLEQDQIASKLRGWRSRTDRIVRTVCKLFLSPLYVYRQFLELARSNLQVQIDRELDAVKERIRATDPEAILLHGRKVYSQFDEDGIIEEIFGRIGQSNSLFVEIGCGNGLENNTHYLLLNGWRGLWIDADEPNIEFIRRNIDCKDTNVLAIECARVNRDNVDRTIQLGLKRIGIQEFPLEIDFLSIDIDGNDLNVLMAISVVRPRVICVEYNAKFPPPLELSIQYDESHIWVGDDYQGASLQTVVNGLEPRGYKLVCCTMSGANALFVKQSELTGISPKKVEELYQPPRYHFVHKRAGHPPSLKFLRNRLRAASRRIVFEGERARPGARR